MTFDKYAEVSRVLWRVLFVNLGVAIAKIALGYVTGAVSILSDGFHSLTDTASNVVGLVGISIARRSATSSCCITRSSRISRSSSA